MKILIYTLVAFVLVGSSCTPKVDLGHIEYEYKSASEFENQSSDNNSYYSPDVLNKSGTIIFDNDSIHVNGESRYNGLSFKVKGTKKDFFNHFTQYLCIYNDESYILTIDQLPSYIQIEHESTRTVYYLKEGQRILSSLEEIDNEPCQDYEQDSLGPIILWPDADIIASFEGSQGIDDMEDNLVEYVNSYRDSISYDGPKGSSHVKFIIDTTGNITNIEIQKGRNEEINAFVIECLNNMPKWEPAMIRGEYMRMEYITRIESY